MAESDNQDRTEQPTPKKLEEAKDRGQVAKSTELNSVAILIAGMLSFKAGSALFGRTLNGFMVATYHESSFIQITTESLPAQMMVFVKVFATLVLPVMGAIVLAALGSNLAQVGFMIAKKALVPKFSKINPLSGLKRMFSSRSLVEMLKGVLKIIILGLIGFWVLDKHKGAFLVLPHQTVAQILTFLGDMLYEMTLKIGIALLIMAAADYAYQRYQHIKELKMSKQEVRDERKQYEGDPQVKQRIRTEQLRMSRTRMFQDIPEATVVVTNPTHIAIALKYEPHSSADAPKVIAKGKRKVAQRIKEVAREHNIPIIENKPLARGLFEACEIGMEIPAAFYQAVAEILSRIYQQNRHNMPQLGEVNG